MAGSSDSPPLGTVRVSFRPKPSGSFPIAGRGRCSWTAEALLLEGRRPNLLAPVLAFLIVLGWILVELSRLIADGRMATDDATVELVVKLVFLPLAVGFLVLVRPIPGLRRRHESIAWRDVETMEVDVDRIVLGVRRSSLLRLELVPEGGIDGTRELEARWRDLVTAASSSRC